MGQEALDLYESLTQNLSMPHFLCHGNHEMENGMVSPDQAGTLHYSKDIQGVHLVVLDVVRHNEPDDRCANDWFGLADPGLLHFLETDLAGLDAETPLIVVSHIALSTTHPFRMQEAMMMEPEVSLELPSNAVVNADRVLELLKPFKNVATLHGHDHENARHYVDHIQIMTTSAVAGNWWKQGLSSFAPHGKEPQGYRVVEVAKNGTITSQYVAFQAEQNTIAELFHHEKSGRHFINVFDGSAKTQVTVQGVGDLPAIDPHHQSSLGLSTHLHELPAHFDRTKMEVQIRLEHGPTVNLLLTS